MACGPCGLREYGLDEHCRNCSKMNNNCAVIVTRDNCEWCDRAKDLLLSRGVGVGLFNYSQDSKFKEFLVGAGFTTVPQVFMGGRHVGGYEDLRKLLEEEDKKNGR